jgi:hypothetical protein
MRRGAWVKRWWGRSALIGAALVVLLGSGTVLFDRNADGVDDGGLDLCAPPHPQVPDPLIATYLVVNPNLSSLLLLPGFLHSPRSPPKHGPVRIFSGIRSRSSYLNEYHT